MAVLITAFSLTAAGAAPAVPPEQRPLVGRTISDVLKNREDLQAFRTALYETRLARRFALAGAFTVFAPTNDAFTVVADEDLDDLLGTRARIYLGRFVLPGSFTPRVLKGMLLARGGQMTLRNIVGGPMAFTLDDAGRVVLEGVARLGEEEIVANGVLIPINRVLPVPARPVPARDF